MIAETTKHGLGGSESHSQACVSSGNWALLICPATWRIKEQQSLETPLMGQAANKT